MTSDAIDRLNADLNSVNSQLRQLEGAKEALWIERKSLRKALAKARKQEASKKPTIDTRLTDAQRKIAELRIATAKALRDRGATIAEVEAVIGVRYSNVKDAEQRLQRNR